MTVNEKLKKIVEEKGLKQSYLCEHTGMTADAISRDFKNFFLHFSDFFLDNL